MIQISVKVDETTKEKISDARLIMESFDSSPAMTIGFDKPTYELTAEQMVQISQALYLADCLVWDVEEILKQNMDRI